MKIEEFLEIDSYLFPPNLDKTVLVEIENNSDDFRKGDLLVLDLSRKPGAGDFIVCEDSPGNYTVQQSSGQSGLGVVTSFVRKLR